MRKYLLLLPLFLIAACSSTSKNYYSLEQDRAVSPLNNISTGQVKAVQVNLKKLPQKLNRPQIIIYDEEISPKLHVLNDSLWVSPLGEQLQNSLADDISNYLGVPDVRGFADKDNIKVFNISVDNYDMHLGKGTYIQANWQEKTATENIICRATIQTKPESDDNVAGLVSTQKDATRALAALIALHDEIKATRIHEKIVSYNLGCT